jgi:hypothetical protein
MAKKKFGGPKAQKVNMKQRGSKLPKGKVGAFGSARASSASSRGAKTAAGGSSG